MCCSSEGIGRMREPGDVWRGNCKVSYRIEKMRVKRRERGEGNIRETKKYHKRFITSTYQPKGFI